MKILSAEDIRLWDQYTIRHEPVSSLDLMERAAGRCVSWLVEHVSPQTTFQVYCGKGNNGGDGLAIARMLARLGRTVQVNILEFGHKGTEDFQANLARLHSTEGVTIRFIQTADNFHIPSPKDVIIDALFGSGLNRKLEGVTAALVEFMNNSACERIAIDIPSGMFVDRSSKDNIIVKADHTLSFQCLKPAFLVAENAKYTGEVHLLDIGLHPGFYSEVSGRFEWTDKQAAGVVYKPRDRFGHKGTFGHGLLVAGGYGKMGAAVLCSRAALRSGIGLLTVHIPRSGYDIFQSSVPEAMALTDVSLQQVTKVEADLTRFAAIGVGPGIGTAPETRMMLRELMDAYRLPVVLDADALNILALQKDLLALVPPGSILTPHPREFQRLFGETESEFDQVELALAKAKELQCVIVLKGHHTLVATPDGKGFFNSTGNAGMATGGSGDVLTGMLTGLLAQGYGSTEAAILGVYLHGLAGDLAASALSMEAMIAGDIIQYFGAAFLLLSQKKELDGVTIL